MKFSRKDAIQHAPQVKSKIRQVRVRYDFCDSTIEKDVDIRESHVRKAIFMCQSVNPFRIARYIAYWITNAGDIDDWECEVEADE